MTAIVPPSATRLAIVAVAAFQVVFGLAVAVAIAPSSLLVDADRALRAAGDLLAGRFGTDHGYLYTPLAALLTVPATWVPAGLAGVAWVGGRLLVLLAGVWRSTQELPSADRVLVGIAAIAFVPTLQDLMLGNVSILLAAAVALIAWSPDRTRMGVPLGIALATVPKPALIPILVWMAMFRRHALVGSVATGAMMSLVAVAIVGIGPYAAWLDVLRHPLYFEGSQAGNLALVGLLPPVIALPLSGLAVGLGVIALGRGETPGLIAAIAVGLLAAPYTIAYGAVFLLLVIRPMAAVLPPTVLTGAAIAAPVLVIVFLPALAGGVLALSLVTRPSRWPRLVLQGAT